jgi:hypothetical protein
LPLPQGKTHSDRGWNLSREGIRVEVLTADVAPEQGEKLVQTGLDLIFANSKERGHFHDGGLCPHNASLARDTPAKAGAWSLADSGGTGFSL